MLGLKSEQLVFGLFAVGRKALGKEGRYIFELNNGNLIEQVRETWRSRKGCFFRVERGVVEELE